MFEQEERQALGLRITLRNLLGWFRPANREAGLVVGTKASLMGKAPGVMALANVANETGADSGGQWGDFEDSEAAVVEDHELLDFLAADVDPVEADPEFKERLRNELWNIVQAGGTELPKDH